MIRFFAVLIAVVIIVTCLIFPRYAAIGLSVGIVMALIFLVIALANGNGIKTASLSSYKGRQSDPDTSISTGLAAAGIGVAAWANPNYPKSFHYFYIAAAVLGCVLALFFAWKGRKPVPAKKDASSAEPPAPQS
jgi:cation transport ATPase